MRFYYDTEFLDDGKTIELISIGIVGEDGSEYYAVNRGAPWKRIYKDDWLAANVVPSLPRYYGDARNHFGGGVNLDDPVVKSRGQIQAEVANYLINDGGRVRDVELWAWFGAYDFVALAQLFGPLVNLPTGIPMWTNDLRQEVRRLGINPESLPQQESGHHNALADARHLKVVYNFVALVAGSLRRPGALPLRRPEGPHHREARGH